MASSRTKLLDAAKVALIPLRPLSIGEILDGAFLIVRQSARSLLGFPLAMIAGLSIMVTAATVMSIALAEVGSSVGVVLVIVMEIVLGALMAGAAMVWLSAVLTRASLLTVMGEGFATPKRLSWREALRWVGPTMAMALLFTVFLTIAQSVAGVINVVMTAAAIANPGVDKITAFLQFAVITAIFMFLLAWMWSWFSLAVPVYVSEGSMAPDWVGKGSQPTNVVMAFVRSAVLVGWKESFRVAAIYLIAASLLAIAVVFVFLGTVALMLLFIMGMGTSMGDLGIEVISTAAIAGLAVALAAVAALGIAYISALQTLVYLDLRMRSEGLDLALRFTNVPVPDASARR